MRDSYELRLGSGRDVEGGRLGLVGAFLEEELVRVVG